jgi:hypothetical protein
MATRQNLIDTYNANPTLQSRYTLQQYLDLFGFGATTTPTQTPTTTPTQTPATPGIPNIINQNLNPGGGGDGGPSNVPEPVQYFDKTYTGATFPDGTPIMSGFEETEGPGFLDSIANTFDGLVGLYQQYSPFGAIGRKIKQNKIAKQKFQDDIIAKAAAERAVKEAEAAALRNAVTYQYNNPSQKAVDDPSGGNRADAFTGGGANVAAANYTSTGREGFGYGLASGGRVGLENGGFPTFSEEDFPFMVKPEGGRPKPSLDYYDDSQESPGDEYPILTIPMGKMKKSKKKKKKEKKFADGGRVYLYNRLK